MLSTAAHYTYSAGSTCLKHNINVLARSHTVLVANTNLNVCAKTHTQTHTNTRVEAWCLSCTMQCSVHAVALLPASELPEQ